MLFEKATLTLATKVEDEKIMVDGKDVLFTDYGCWIDGVWFTKSTIQALLTLNPIFQRF
mgnify:FL=1